MATKEELIEVLTAALKPLHDRLDKLENKPAEKQPEGHLFSVVNKYCPDGDCDGVNPNAPELDKDLPCSNCNVPTSKDHKRCWNCGEKFEDEEGNKI